MKRKVLISILVRSGICLIVAAIIFGAVFIDAEFVHFNIYAGVDQHNQEVLEFIFETLLLLRNKEK